jgi:hypothetical protein
MGHPVQLWSGTGTSSAMEQLTFGSRELFQSLRYSLAAGEALPERCDDQNSEDDEQIKKSHGWYGGL